MFTTNFLIYISVFIILGFWLGESLTAASVAAMLGIGLWVVKSLIFTS